MVDGYTQVYDTEDMTEITTDAIAVGMITGKEFVALMVLGLVLTGLIGLAVGIKLKVRKG